MVHVSRSVEIAALLGSVGMFVVTVVAIPIFFTRIPEDFFVDPRRHSLPRRVLHNFFGGLLVGLGIAMLVLPGQGLLTMLVGLMFLDVPFKQRILRWALLHPKVKHAVDAMRAKAGRGPLIPPPLPA